MAIDLPEVVELRRAALVNLLLMAKEVYRRECVGLLVGRRARRRLVVELAVPYQVADRTFRRSRASPRSHRRLFNAIEELGAGWELVGDFHSHTQYGDHVGVASPSMTDVHDMLAGHAHLIIAINDTDEPVPFTNDDGIVHGSVGRHRYAIAAYGLDPDADDEERRFIAVPLRAEVETLLEPPPEDDDEADG